ncbi:hypothetical protein DSO57_1025480 [Entomophthora muscae]|uniref:Uncharacterized protein n=1 Tax=Entomophthora muscae TaxID=34485 RepID=A0ACC2RTG5_9FUNG|nr:hypothetical protein DSO57_1025480 [Entomophthora muscae]
MAVWDIASQFGVTARYIGDINKKYGNTGQIAKSTKSKKQPKLLQPIHFEAIKQWVTKDCHLDSLAVPSMLVTEFGLSVSKTLVYKAMVKLGFSWKVLRVSSYNRNSKKTIKEQHIYAKSYLALKETDNVQFFYIDKSFFSSSLRSRHRWVKKGSKDGVAHHAAVCSQTYSMVALLGPCRLDQYKMIKDSHNSAKEASHRKRHWTAQGEVQSNQQVRPTIEWVLT